MEVILKILIVGQFDNCWSLLVAQLLREATALDKTVETVESAGLGTGGNIPVINVGEVLRRNSITSSLSQRGKSIEATGFGFDYFLCESEVVAKEVRARLPKDARGSVEVFGKPDGSSSPYGGAIEEYEIFVGATMERIDDWLSARQRASAG